MCPLFSFHDILTLRRATHGKREIRPPNRPQICPESSCEYRLFTPTCESSHAAYTNLMNPYSKNMSQNAPKNAHTTPQNLPNTLLISGSRVPILYTERVFDLTSRDRLHCISNSSHIKIRFFSLFYELYTLTYIIKYHPKSTPSGFRDTDPNTLN